MKWQDGGWVNDDCPSELTGAGNRVDLEDVAELLAGVLEVLPPDEFSPLDRDVRSQVEAFITGVRAATDSGEHT